MFYVEKNIFQTLSSYGELRSKLKYSLFGALKCAFLSSKFAKMISCLLGPFDIQFISWRSHIVALVSDIHNRSTYEYNYLIVCVYIQIHVQNCTDSSTSTSKIQILLQKPRIGETHLEYTHTFEPMY